MSCVAVTVVVGQGWVVLKTFVLLSNTHHNYSDLLPRNQIHVVEARLTALLRSPGDRFFS